MDNEKKKFAVIVVNDKSGRGKRANVDKLKKTMLNTYDVRVFHITDGEGFSYVPCDVICCIRRRRHSQLRREYVRRQGNENYLRSVGHA